MRHIGYSVFVDGKPAGILWPDRSNAEGTARHYAQKNPGADITILSLYADIPMPMREPETGSGECA